MLHMLKPATWMAFVLVCLTGLTGIAWQTNPAGNHNKAQQDTLPKQKKERVKEDKTVINGDIDKAIEEVNKAKENLEQQLQNKDWEKMHRDMEQSLEKLNAENIQEQMKNAMKQLDMQKIQMEVQASLKKVDWEKMQQDLQKVQAELKTDIDSKKIEAEIQQAMEQAKKAMSEMKAIDMEKFNRAFERSKEALQRNEGRIKEEIEKAGKNIHENLSKDFKKELQKAREDVDRATEELKNYQNMLTEMEAAGLLNVRQPYSVEYKKGELIINGQKQPDNITNKYKHYFRKENVKITKGKEGDADRTIEL
ncbi:MAG: hypothetical protein ABIQ88_07175 [Chitinophagaceae bacterium]